MNDRQLRDIFTASFKALQYSSDTNEPLEAMGHALQSIACSLYIIADQTVNNDHEPIEKVRK